MSDRNKKTTYPLHARPNTHESITSNAMAFRLNYTELSLFRADLNVSALHYKFQEVLANKQHPVVTTKPSNARERAKASFPVPHYPITTQVVDRRNEQALQMDGQVCIPLCFPLLTKCCQLKAYLQLAVWLLLLCEVLGRMRVDLSWKEISNCMRIEIGKCRCLANLHLSVHVRNWTLLATSFYHCREHASLLVALRISNGSPAKTSGHICCSLEMIFQFMKNKGIPFPPEGKGRSCPCPALPPVARGGPTSLRADARPSSSFHPAQPFLFRTCWKRSKYLPL